MFRSSWLKDLLLLTLITSLFFGAFLGTRNLSAPDELRYSEIPREMIVNHDYLIPKLNGVKYFEKPPLVYWMQVASIKVFGLNEWALRLPTAFMALIGVLATYLFSRRLFGRKTGVLSALILSSMVLYFAMAHVITLDMTVSVLITLSLYLFFLATKSASQSKWPIWGGFIVMAGSVMTKGLIGIVFPVAILGLWVLFFNQWRSLKNIHLLSGLLLFVLLVAPWHILVQLKAPEFFHFYFIEQQFLRYATNSAHRYHSPLFYVPVILLGTLPWVFFLPQSLKFLKRVRWKNRLQFETELFLLGWSLFVILFFSESNSKLIPYVLPALPPLAILIARYCTAFVKLRTVILCYLSTNLLMIVALTQVDYFDNHSVKPLVMFVQQHEQPGDEVIMYHGYHQDIPYYLQRTITVDESFDELTFGAAHGDTQQWMINEDEFAKRWESNRTIYLFITEKYYKLFVKLYPENKGWIVAHDEHNLLVTNQEKT